MVQMKWSGTFCDLKLHPPMEWTGVASSREEIWAHFCGPFDGEYPGMDDDAQTYERYG